MRNLWISLFALTISMGSVMAEINPKVIKNWEKFLEEAEKITGRKLKATTGGKSKNHQLTKDNIGALDIGKNANKLSKEEYDEVGKLAIRHGFRVGDEKNHLHIDNRTDNTTRVFDETHKAAPASNKFLKERDRVVKTKSSMFDNRVLNKENSRTPQSVEEPMVRKEDEEEGKLDKFRRNANTKMQENTPSGQQMSEAQKRMFEKENINPENQVKVATESQVKKSKGEQVSAKDSFMEAITYFLPSIAGLAVGGAIGGAEGAAQGAQLGMKAGESYYSAKERQLDREQKERLAQQRQVNPLAQERLKMQQSNLELRKQEIAEQRKRTDNLEEDRSLRREERKLQRQITAKESFGKRGDVKKLQDQGLLLTDMNNIITDAPEIAAGVISFKIAKGIAGEVGNLTQAEREDAQISPSFYSKMLRGGTKFFTGELPEEDVKELNKVIKVLDTKRKQKLGSIIDGFTKSRYKGDDAFRSDLRNEFGVEEKEEKKAQTSKDKFGSWDKSKQERYLQWKARRNK